MSVEDGSFFFEPFELHLQSADLREQLLLIDLIALSRANAQAAAEDPATAAVWSHLENYAPLRGEECAIVTRFWLSLDRHQSVVPECASLFLHTLGFCLAAITLLIGDRKLWTSPQPPQQQKN